MHQQKSGSSLKKLAGRLPRSVLLAVGLSIAVMLLFGLNSFSANDASLMALRSLSSEHEGGNLTPDADRLPLDAFWRAQALNRESRYEEALAVLLESKPDSARAAAFREFALCETYANLGRAQDAVRACAAIGSYHHLAASGWNLIRNNQPAEAEVLFSAVFEKRPLLGINGLVQASLSTGNLDLAENALRVVLAEYPDNTRKENWLLLLGETLVENGKFGDAVDVYRLLIQDNPGSAEGHFLLGEALYNEQGLSAALPIIEEGLRLSPTSARGPELLGSLLSLEGRFDEADRYFLEAVVLSDENNFWIRLTAAENAFLARNFPTAIARYTAILDTFQQQMDDPVRLNTEYLLGLSYAGNGERDNAITVAEQITAVNPGDVDALIRAARILEQAGATTLAIQAYEKALDLNPADESVVTNLTRILVAVGDLAKAARVLEQAIAQPGPGLGNQEWRFRLGQILATDTRFSDAQSVLESYIEDFPDDADAFFLLASVVYQTEGFAAATAILATGMRLNPDSPKGPLAMGDLLVAEGRRLDADLYYQEAVRLSPDTDFWIRIKTATNAFYGEQYPLAIEGFVGVLDAYRDRLPVNVLGNALYLLGSAYALEGNAPQALLIIEDYLAVLPGDPQALAQAGRIYELSGFKDEALETYKKALAMDPSIELAINGLKRLVDSDG